MNDSAAIFAPVTSAGPFALPSVEHLPEATPHLLAKRALLERVDRKFVTTTSRLAELLLGLGTAYPILLSEGNTWARYQTCYLDTEQLSMFREHLRGRRPRYKIRMRRHVDRHRAFLEIKKKRANERTEKFRTERPYEQDALTHEELAFVAQHTPFDSAALSLSVWTNFYRATLLGVESEERLTIDVGLHFERNGQSAQLQQLAIVELKQRRQSNLTTAAKLLHAMRIREQSMSKYCTGVAHVHEGAPERCRQLLLKKLSRLNKWKTI